MEIFDFDADVLRTLAALVGAIVVFGFARLLVGLIRVRLERRRRSRSDR